MSHPGAPFEAIFFTAVTCSFHFSHFHLTFLVLFSLLKLPICSCLIPIFSTGLFNISIMIILKLILIIETTGSYLCLTLLITFFRMGEFFQFFFLFCLVIFHLVWIIMYKIVETEKNSIYACKWTWIFFRAHFSCFAYPLTYLPICLSIIYLSIWPSIYLLCHYYLQDTKGFKFL